MQSNLVLSEDEYKVLKALAHKDKKLGESELVEELHMDQSKVAASGLTLSQKGFVTITEEVYKSLC